MNVSDPVLRFRNRFRKMPHAWLAVAAFLVVAIAVTGGVLLRRTYDYVQHDNEFCLSCHLMVEPYERFARSAHRGLGCKACHQPTMVARSRMALTQILEQPEAVHTHAEVPNERCAECHIEGDPDEWLLIAASAGHRVHLESDDPSLEGLNCVECHSSSVHEFTPSRQTCGQADCHENLDVRLGNMSDLTLHCIACHPFLRPIGEAAPAETAGVALRPRLDQCLACHRMRMLIEDFPADEPHGGVCGSCHNPHEQPRAREAVRSCTNAGCHAQPDSLTPTHRGLGPGESNDCLLCHGAHDFQPAGVTCMDCHRDIFEEPSRQRRAAAGDRARRLVAAAPARAPADAAGGVAALEDTAPVLDAGFRHAPHRELECAACHGSEREHGSVEVEGPHDCNACHHAEPAATPCRDCHEDGDLGRRAYLVLRTLRMSVATPTRALPLDHRTHRDVGCVECHAGGLARTAADVQCSDCHARHHEPDAACAACHAQPPADAHALASHLGCAGSGCHAATELPFRVLPRTRGFCLTCHQQLADHRPERACVDCHTMPASRAAAADRVERQAVGGAR